MLAPVFGLEGGDFGPVEEGGCVGGFAGAGEGGGELGLGLEEDEDGPEPGAVMPVLGERGEHGEDQEAHGDVPENVGGDGAKGGEGGLGPAFVRVVVA